MRSRSPDIICKKRFIDLLLILFLFSFPLFAKEGNDPLERIVKLPKLNKTIYEILDVISEKSGYLFIYDSKWIDNKKRVSLPKGNYSIRNAVERIIDNDSLTLQIIEDHILIKPETKKEIKTNIVAAQKKDTSSFSVLEGLLIDKDTREPLDAATIGLEGTSIGTISNANGKFRLSIPDSLSRGLICFSHLGYIPQNLKSSILIGNHTTIALEPRSIPLQEIVIRIINPIHLLKDVRLKRDVNYIQHPFYLTSFYREGIERKNTLVGLTEAIFKIYKPGYKPFAASDQVKLLKMRKISSLMTDDTIIAKMKSGINASLMLDIMQNLPDFLDPEEQSVYTYISTGLITIEGKTAQIINFEQQKGVAEPLYKGNIYIDTETHSLLRIDFEINPNHISKATYMLIERKSKNIKISPHKVIYSVSYKSLNGQYYISHVRGNLYFKMKKRGQIFGSTSLHTWFELVTGKIDQNNVVRFAKNETLSPKSIFADTKFRYDKDFWENYNFIIPEEQLYDAIMNMTSKVEERSE